MEPITTAPPPAFSSNSAVARAEQAAAPALSSDFDTFLRMLTAQMQNQDPLNPVDSTDFATQLATFSSVEQQVLTNDLLTQLGEQMGSSTMSQLANWVGMEARAPAPVEFSGAPVSIVPKVAAGADAADLIVRDANGTEVQRLPIALDGAPVEWAGVGDDGTALPSGTYRFDVESRSEGTLIESNPALTYNRITEARVDGQDIMLRLSGGTEILSNLVTGLRASTTG